MDSLRSDDQDPDYFTLFNDDTNRENQFETNARENTANKISKIIETEFLNEINSKKAEIYKIYKTLNKACKMLHYLRFAIVTDFYNQDSIQNNDAQALKQSRLHSTLTYASKEATNNIPNASDCFQECLKDITRKRKISEEHNKFKRKRSENEHLETISDNSAFIGINSKIKKRIIVGNISKWIAPDLRDSNATHKWTVYIRDSNKSDLGQFISKVRFFLHPSYKPNDVIELTSGPFHISRHGWGEFPVRVQLHFTNSFNKPVDIIHYLKLDRTFTGLQTIGSETIVDLWIKMKDTNPAFSEFKECSDVITDIAVKDECKASDLLQDHYFLNDHNYVGKNIKLDKESYNSNKLTQKTPETNNKPSTEYSNFDVEMNFNKVFIKSEYTLSEPDTEQSLNQNLNNMEKNFINDSPINKNESICDTSVHNSLQNLSIDSSKINSKNSDINYEENSNALINLIASAKPKTLFNALKLLMRRIPLIFESSESYYDMVYSEVSESYQEFCNYSTGKRQALERYRAIYALNILSNSKSFSGLCSINDLIIWARRYCYTPILNLKNLKKICLPKESENEKNDNSSYECTSTVSDELSKWLRHCQVINQSYANFNSESDNEIDIINIPVSIPNTLTTYNDDFEKEEGTKISIKYPEMDDILTEYVCNCVQKIGLKLVNEEIIPGVLHHSASLVMTKAVEYLIDDLIRIAFSCALDKSEAERNTIYIKSDDVRMALLKREEFDIFTNAGLGSEG